MLKGTGFSPYKKLPQIYWALAPEGIEIREPANFLR